MLRRGAMFLAAAIALVGCDDEFDNGNGDNGSNDNGNGGEPFDPIADSWNLDVQARNIVGAEGARAVVAVYNVTEDDLEARVDTVVEGGRFRVIFDTELEDGDDYDIYWWLDFNDAGECDDDVIYVVPTGVVTSDIVVKLDPAVDDVTTCDNVDGFHLFD